MIGIIVADSNEINKFPYKIKSEKKFGPFKFIIFENDVVLVQSGIGIANASAATTALISLFDVNDIVNYGAVGGFGPVEIYDIILPKKIFYHDVKTPWYKRGQTPGEKEFYINSIIGNKYNNIASGSSFLYNEDDLVDVQKHMDVDIFDMEVAGIAQICDKFEKKLYVIKCVSDVIGSNNLNLENINDRIKKAGAMAFEKTLVVIDEILKSRY